MTTAKTKKSFDVCIVGAGIAGLHLANLLRAKKINVGLIDQHPPNNAGPNWINAVPLWMFDEALLAK